VAVHQHKRIERRRDWNGAGGLAEPDYLERLQERRDIHARLIAGKPERTFAAILHEKIYGPPLAEPTEAAPRDAGAIDPHLGLSPGQNSDMLVRGKGHRSGRVIVKG